MVSRVVLAALAALVASSASATPTTRMDRSRLRIGAYSFGKVAHDEAQVRAAKECGIDFVLGVKATDRAALDLLAKYKIGVIAGGMLPGGWWGGDGSNAGKMRTSRPKDVFEGEMAKYAESLDHPAIWMISLCDEPSALDMPYLGELCDVIAKYSPQTPAYINLYPNYASIAVNTGTQTRSQLGTKTYKEHIDVYCQTVPLDYISYDFYVYTPKREQRAGLCRRMYENFKTVADACRRTGRSLWYIPQVNSYKATPFEPTTCNRLRFQAYTAMAFGVESISWACWMPGWWTNNVLTATGEKTDQYERLKIVNAEIHRFGPHYMRYRSTATHFVGFAPTNGVATIGVPLLSKLDANSFFDLRTRENSPLVVGEMTPRSEDDDSCALFVVASGDPFDEAPARRTVTFRVPNGRIVKAFGCNGHIKLMREANGVFTLPLEENSAVLLASRPAKGGKRGR